MTVLSATTLTVKLDRYEDFLASAEKSKLLLEKHGAKNVRLIVGMSGELSASFTLTHEANDFTDAGRITDKFLADPEGLAVMTESGSAAGPAANWHPSTWVEIRL
jgi:hypothetical protein